MKICIHFGNFFFHKGILHDVVNVALSCVIHTYYSDVQRNPKIVSHYMQIQMYASTSYLEILDGVP